MSQATNQITRLVGKRMVATSLAGAIPATRWHGNPGPAPAEHQPYWTLYCDCDPANIVLLYQKTNELYIVMFS